MFVRICVIAVALLLVAAPAAPAEIVDAQAEHTCDALVLPVAIVLPPPAEGRVAIVQAHETPSPSPTLSQIFRPPRVAFV